MSRRTGADRSTEGDGHAPSPSISAAPLAALRERLAECSEDEAPALLALFDEDPRPGVRALAATWRRRRAAAAAEDARLERLNDHQGALHAAGIAVVAGFDEVGRGALAGPLSVAAVVLSVATRIPRLNDSKRLAPAVREAVAAQVRRLAEAVRVVHIEPDEIDAVGIGEAVRVGMRRALDGLGTPVDHCLVDGNDARLGVPATAVVKGDSLCACIAAASVVAKVERDSLMVDLAAAYPGYDLALNKGYGTAEHIAAIATLGPSPIHRRSFGPCSQTRLFR